MRTIIAGSRNITEIHLVKRAIKSAPFKVTTVICCGANTLGREWAEANNVPVEMFPADWDKHGKAAGFIRNGEMAEVAEALITVWDGKSKGTEHMIDIAQEKGLKIFVLGVE